MCAEMKARLQSLSAGCFHRLARTDSDGDGDGLLKSRTLSLLGFLTK